ncbi:hypothetical protein SAMD00019534_112310 [Acytostelium subglobosum LB1]|uniref:hypothetical protein n=1 Tax=Acytostelium subglobosum LB1 TaxID=1410327 RepID=UPI0006451A0B|nr:hypothetical protein SAMD00019534_112310 [Acytostelium subglobosum LB1]GAM28055.1 hypothetical protein SAMD00019534_112310 [Acytostelium subglobosum LB1]|eukprot:XP_012749014.1 hypothetical protein SAMD00019534_112310 [Acytostelium subglobosum LB1]
MCSDNYWCDSNTRICIAQRYLGLGETCGNNSLYCNEGLVCEQSICVNVNYPGCIDRTRCPWNETCISNKCTSPIPDGEACTVQSECSINSGCVANKCVPNFSLGLNSKCLFSFDCDFSQGLICLNKTCRNKDELFNAQCNATYQCPTAICMCNANVLTSGSSGKCGAQDDYTMFNIDYINDINIINFISNFYNIINYFIFISNNLYILYYFIVANIDINIISICVP